MKNFFEKYPAFSAVLALALLSGIWGYNWVVMKVALKYSPPFPFAALRTLLGSITLFAVLLMSGKLRIPDDVPQVFLLGFLQNTVFLAFTLLALMISGAGKTAILVFTMPFWVIIMAWILFKEQIRGIQWFAVIFSLAGLILILYPWNLGTSLLGNILAVLAGISWATGTIIAKRIHQNNRSDTLSVTAWQMFFGAVPLAILALLIPAADIKWSLQLIAALIYNIFLCNALAWFLWLYILKVLPAGTASLGSLIIPVVGVLSAWIQLGEEPGLIEGAGMLLIVSALLVISINSLRR